MECADGTVQRIYQIPDEDKAKVLADLYPMTDVPSIDDTLYDIHERKEFKVRDFFVIRWCEGNLLASPFFPHSGGMLVDWITAEQAKGEGNGTIVDLKVAICPPIDENEAKLAKNAVYPHKNVDVPMANSRIASILSQGAYLALNASSTTTGITMTLSYKKLWHRLIDKEMTKTELQKAAGLSWGTVAKLNRGENVNTSILMRTGLA